jgi:hypothetical protein
MSIRLSPKYGVNPAIPHCFFCGKEKNEILLPGKLEGDVEAPKGVVWDKEPCQECDGYMQRGIILISVRDNPTDSDRENPHRTGGWCVVREEFISNNIDAETAEAILQKRVCFIEDKVWRVVGLPFPGITPLS